jgi:hypothetical protein
MNDRIIDDWMGSTEDAITALQGWLDSLREWQRNGVRELAKGDFMEASRRMADLMGDEWADRNPCDIDRLAAIVQGEELIESGLDPWVGRSQGKTLGQVEL